MKNQTFKRTKDMKKLLLALIIIQFIFFKGLSQTYSLTGNLGTITTCAGTFYDSGGSAGSYTNGQNRTVTFCSGNGQPIYLNFTQFATEAGFDVVTIYNGPSTASPGLGTYSGTNSPGIIVATSGCITIRFVSDGSVTGAGWTATIGCGTPPPSPNMSNASITACSGNFYDSGGAGANYGNNQTFVYTICPSTPGAKVRVTFSAFSLENNFDFLQIYDGASIAAPSLGAYTGTTSPGIVTATAANASGCLTFRFTSDVSVTYAGWIAAITCISPCQTITSNFVSSNPAPQADGIIRICQGQSVSFTGSGTFSTSGIGATYQWNLGNGTTAIGTTASTTYNAAGTYTVNLNITDPSGCTNSNLLNRKVQVSTTPTITTSAVPTTICQGQSANLNAAVTMTPFIQNCTPPVSGTTFLPDGTGASYNTAITVNCYNTNQTVTSASDFQNVCLNMEHSYVGDLTIRLICPNGQSTILKAYPGGGGTYLGCPLDDPAVGPGTGRVYCFTPTATTLLINGPTSTCGTPANLSINTGSYMPSQPFTNLIGCPLNGAWTIQVTDNMGIDNGYIFNWDVNFNSSIPTNTSSSFTPTIVSQGWVANPALTSTGTTTATVTPTTTGNNCYTYAITDNFGCNYNAIQCITVNPCLNCTASNTGAYCPGQTIQLNVVAAGGTTFSWVGPNGFTSNLQNPTIPNATAAMAGVYTVTVTDGSGGTCTSTTTVVINPAPTLTCPPTLTLTGCNTPVPAGATTIASFTSLGGSTNGTSITYTDAAATISGCTETVIRTYTATLGSCTSSCTQTINRIVDTQAPVVTGTITAQTITGCVATDAPAAQTTVAGLEGLGITIADNCTADADLVVTFTETSAGTCPLVITRTYTITDACNNQTTVTETINVGDNVAPVVTGTITAQTITGCVATDAPAAQTTVAGLEGLGITIADNCTADADLVVTFTETSAGTCPLVITRTYTITDACNNQTTVTETINTGDIINPVFNNFPADITVNCDAVPLVGSVVINGSDNCTSNPTVTFVGETGTPSSCGYSLIRTWSLSDACGNTITNSQTINVLPSSAPTVTLPTGLPTSLTCAAAELFTNATDATYTNNSSGACLIDGIISPSITSNYTACNGGTITIDYIGTDVCNNPLNAQHVITITPPVAPTVSLPSGLPVTLSCASSETFTTPANATFTNSESGTCLITGSLTPTVTSNYTSCTGGSITINYSGSDVCGNLLSAQHIITVTPPTTPVITVPTGLPNTLSYNNALTYTTAPNATYSNNEPTNCLITGSIPAVITPNYDICNGGTITIDYNGQDLCGNPLTAQHIINVTPEIPSVSINSTLSVIDINQPTQLTAVGTPAGGTYTWSPSGTLDTSTGDVVNATPITTTTYTVTYDIGNNCTATATTTITVNTLTLGVNSTTICSGSSTSLTATPSVTGGTYLWSPGGQTTQTITVSPTTNAIYTCVYTLNGVSSAPTIGTVTVNPTPTVTVNNPTICSGTSATITAVGNPSGGSYLWAPGGQTTASISVSPAATTTYTVTYTLNNCQGTATSTVTVNPQPTVSVSSATICAGESTTITATPNPAGGTFMWNNSQTNSSITVSPITTTTYTVMYTLNGCVATGTGTVTVNPIPTVAVSSATICNGESATINATPSAAGGSYSWSPGGATTQSITVNPSSTSSYSVTYTLNGCTSQSASGTVTVNSVPTVSVNSVSICDGDNATLTASPSLPGGTYLWAPSGEQTSSISISPNTTSSYSVVYTLNGCQSAPANGTVNVNPIPAVSFTADQLTGCAPLTVNLSNTAGNPSNCSWNVGNGQLINGCNAEYTFIQGGCYDISLTTTENGCSNTLTLNDYICVENPPVAAFSTNPTEFTEPTQSVSFSNNSVGATSYSWNFGDTQSSTDENPVHLYSNTTNGYTITLTATSALGCTDTYQVSIGYQEDEIFYIPNTFTPDGDNYNQTFKPIFTSGFDPFNFEMLIFNRWGEVVFETHDVKVGWDGSYGIKGRDVQDGTYTYKIIYKNPKNDQRRIIVGHITLIR